MPRTRIILLAWGPPSMPCRYTACGRLLDLHLAGPPTHFLSVGSSVPAAPCRACASRGHATVGTRPLAAFWICIWPVPPRIFLAWGLLFRLRPVGLALRAVMPLPVHGLWPPSSFAFGRSPTHYETASAS